MRRKNCVEQRGSYKTRSDLTKLRTTLLAPSLAILKRPGTGKRMAMDHTEVNLILEAMNGAIFILVCSLISCLMIYIRMVYDNLRLHLNKDLTFWEFLVRSPPPGVRLARPMTVLKAGAALSLCAAWIWRLTGGYSIPKWVIVQLCVGMLVLGYGCFWLIYVLTYARYGWRVVNITVALIVGYVVTTLLGHYLLG
jgi:hypothetical protein